jgi:hypothetical protein
MWEVTSCSHVESGCLNRMTVYVTVRHVQKSVVYSVNVFISSSNVHTTVDPLVDPYYC